ncbi:hypothetical protein LQ953_06420 [Sphingomonas sp. IC-56]|uniref:hypothetical protein n=1 Tax=Sphingomonas sp. IC-56 TaxID=2898529 RepID=UPI001E5B8FFF|nr:hypothetical protein [Sphingomonas sp. IC-56]MCD2323649.1 hypothetical protein [Sphingomonas sp. IC-56]
MLKRIALFAAVAIAPFSVPGAAQAQNAAQNGVLVIYGEDKCPTNSNGEEVVICRRLDESERFRIPKTLREQPGPPQQTESWAVRSQGALEEGAFGTGSCSTVGAGGGTGCFVRQARQAKAESNARREAQNNLPLP